MKHRPVQRASSVFALLVMGACGAAAADAQQTESAPDYQIQLDTVAAQPTLSVRGSTALTDVPATIAERTRMVWQHVQAIGAEAVGPPFTRYHDVADDRADLEVGFPVLEPAEGSAEVEAGELPGGPVVWTVHVGRYDGLGEAGGALDRWLESNGRTERGPSWEIYEVNAGMVSDPSEYETRVVKPIR